MSGRKVTIPVEVTEREANQLRFLAQQAGVEVSIQHTAQELLRAALEAAVGDRLRKAVGRIAPAPRGRGDRQGFRG